MILPSELIQSAELRDLDLSYSEYASLPDRYSSITQLSLLDLGTVSFEGFPECIMHLFQSQHLRLAWIYPPLAIEEEHLAFADSPDARLEGWQTHP